MSTHIIDSSSLRTKFNKTLISKNDRIILTSYNCIFIYNDSKEKWISYTSIKDILLCVNHIQIIFKDISTIEIISDDNHDVLSEIFSQLCSRFFSNKPLQYSTEILQNILSLQKSTNVRIDCLSNDMIDKEMLRQQFKLLADEWVVCDVNKDYKLCDSYSQKILLPNNSSLRNCIIHARNFRDQQRFPIVSYINKNLNLILRSSQPMIGIMSKTNSQDEFLIKGYLKSADTKETNKFIIVDCRPIKNVYAQRYILGGGTENILNYQFSDLKSKDLFTSKAYFLGFPNVHILSDQYSSMEDYFILGKNHQKEEINPLNFDWYLNIKHVMKEVDYLLKEYLLNGSHLLIHCTHGWDRTSLTTSLMMICSDPYYRTIEGFLVLVQLEWLNYGFRFAERFDVNEYILDDFEVDTVASSDQISANKSKNGFLINRLEYLMVKTKNHNIMDIPTNFKKKLGNIDIKSISSKLGLNDEEECNNRVVKRLSEHLYWKQKKSTIDYNNVEDCFNTEEENETKKICKNTSSKGGASPVFVQFLDIIYQLIKQYDTQFEYNGKFLLRILKEVTSGKYYEFLLNNDKERNEYLKSLKLSVEQEKLISWYNLIEIKDSERNTKFQRAHDKMDQWIFPNESKVVLWKSLWKS